MSSGRKAIRALSSKIFILARIAAGHIDSPKYVPSNLAKYVQGSAELPRGARGLSPELSRRLLVQAFLGDALVGLDDAEQRETMMRIALNKVDRAL